MVANGFSTASWQIGDRFFVKPVALPFLYH